MKINEQQMVGPGFSWLEWEYKQGEEVRMIHVAIDPI